ncbi:MAG: CRAL-TRIO domain-containing protein [Benjaminiella poitrasii]|nr:MAG: CRAL-TRIO domain-containing protein [Benjaminiella poitrasii]
MAIQQITSTEKELVAKLKAKLNEIKQAARVAEGYKLWDITLDQDSTDPRLDIVLVKFLRARDLDLSKASQMLTNTLIWRKDFRADELLDEAIDDSILGSVSYVYKNDKEGRPVCYNFYGDLDQDKVFGDVQKFIRWRVQVMERGVQLIDFVHTDSMVVIHDYKKASLFGRTQNAKTATKEIIKIMQDNYPEFLAVKYFVNVPSWGSIIFKLVRPLLSEATTRKFVVCSNDQLYQTLTNSIEEGNLPKVYQQNKVEDRSSISKENKKVEEATTVETNNPAIKMTDTTPAADTTSMATTAAKVNADAAGSSEEDKTVITSVTTTTNVTAPVNDTTITTN